MNPSDAVGHDDEEDQQYVVFPEIPVFKNYYLGQGAYAKVFKGIDRESG